MSEIKSTSNSSGIYGDQNLAAEELQAEEGGSANSNSSATSPAGGGEKEKEYFSPTVRNKGIPNISFEPSIVGSYGTKVKASLFDDRRQIPSLFDNGSSPLMLGITGEVGATLILDKLMYDGRSTDDFLPIPEGIDSLGAGHSGISFNASVSNSSLQQFLGMNEFSDSSITLGHGFSNFITTFEYLPFDGQATAGIILPIGDSSFSLSAGTQVSTFGQTVNFGEDAAGVVSSSIKINDSLTLNGGVSIPNFFNISEFGAGLEDDTIGNAGYNLGGKYKIKTGVFQNQFVLNYRVTDAGGHEQQGWDIKASSKVPLKTKASQDPNPFMGTIDVKYTNTQTQYVDEVEPQPGYPVVSEAQSLVVQQIRFDLGVSVPMSTAEYSNSVIDAFFGNKKYAIGASVYAMVADTNSLMTYGTVTGDYVTEDNNNSTDTSAGAEIKLSF